MKANVPSTSEFASNPVGTMELQTMAKTAKIDKRRRHGAVGVSGNVTHLIAADHGC
jgi:hypothetical protein